MPSQNEKHPLAQAAPGPWTLDKGDGERMFIISATGGVVAMIDARDYQPSTRAMMVATFIVESGPK